MALTDKVDALAARTALEIKAVRVEIAAAGTPRGTITYTGPIEAGTVFTSVLPEGVISADRQWTLDGVNIDGETGETWTATGTGSLKALGCKLSNPVYAAVSIDLPEIDAAEIVILGLPVWSAALNAVRAGERNARVMILGDSIPRGYYTGGVEAYGNNEAAHNWVSLLADKITTETTFKGANNSWIGNGNIGHGSGDAQMSAYDNRISYGGTWSNSEEFGTGGMTVGGFNLYSVGGGRSPLDFAPDDQTDTVEVFYPRAPFMAGDGFNVGLASGGATTLIDSYGAAAAFVKTTVTRALGTNVWRATPISDDTSFLAGMIAYNSAEKEITLLNASWSGGRIADHASNVTSGLPRVGYETYAPDLAIIVATGNDILTGSNEATYKGNLNTLIDEFQRIGSDVLVVLPTPANPALAGMNNLRTWTTAVATAQGTPLIDLFDIFDYEDAVAAGWYAPDGTHVIGAGQAAICDFIYDRIMI